MQFRGAMKRVLALLVLCSCATVPIVGEEPSGEPVEVTGRVVSACGPSEPLPREPVAIRAAGELEVLDSTETDAQGAFSFRVSQKPPLFIEARGVKAVAKPARRGLVAELVLPCTGG